MTAIYGCQARFQGATGKDRDEERSELGSARGSVGRVQDCGEAVGKLCRGVEFAVEQQTQDIGSGPEPKLATALVSQCECHGAYLRKVLIFIDKYGVFESILNLDDLVEHH